MNKFSCQWLFNAIVLMGCSSALAYEPPLGIPDPTWGALHPIETAAPSWPEGWPSSEVVDHYYLDNTHPNATNTKNPYGYPDKPRLTTPKKSFPAGTYIEINGGPYTRLTENRLQMSCTEDNPCWLRGGSETNKTTIRSRIEITNSSYFIMENLDFDGDYDPGNPDNNGHLKKDWKNEALKILGDNTHHIAFRNSIIQNREFSSPAAGINILPFHGGKIHDVVIYNNIFRELGDWLASKDTDFHGINPTLWGRNNTTEEFNIWILNNEFYHLSGNGVQVNAGNFKDSYKYLHHIYIGKNTAYANRQSGFWSKQASHVIISENIAYDHRSHGSQPGDGIGYQYGPDNLWIIFNTIYDSNNGIRQSDTGVDNPMRSSYIIGNLIYDIHPEASVDYNPISGFRYGQAVNLWHGNMKRYIVDNTFYNTNGGINVNYAGDDFISGNIISGRHPQDTHISIAQDTGKVILENNLFYDKAKGVRVYIKPTLYTDTNSASLIEGDNPLCVRCLVDDDPMFVNPAAFDFTLLKTTLSVSPAINAGVADSVSDVYAKFKDLYGIDIRKDKSRTKRTKGFARDIGSYELETLSPPSGLILN